MPMANLKLRQIPLCSCLEEILAIIWCHFQNRKKIDLGSKCTEPKLKVFINVKNKSKESKENFDVFTIKVKCNQDVPFISMLRDIHPSKLSQFVCQMQAHEEESHIIVCLADTAESALTKRSALWISLDDGMGSGITILDESLTSRKPIEEDIFVLQLRVFMKVSTMMKEVCAISRLLCYTKMLNPEIQLCFSLDGSHDKDLKLTNEDVFPCGSLLMSADPKVYHYRKGTSSGDGIDPGGYTPDMSQVIKIQVSSQDLQGTSTDSLVLTSLIFIPKNINNTNNNLQHEQGAIVTSHGEIFIQAFEPGRLPMDMLEFCRQFQTDPVSLIPWDDLKGSIKMLRGFCSSYNTGCNVEILGGGGVRMPRVVRACDTFTLSLCLILQHPKDALKNCINGDILDCIRKSIKESFMQFFSQDVEEEKQEISIHNIPQDSVSVTRWIPDIADCLSQIYTKSTHVDFRASMAHMAPVHTCLSMKTYLQEKLERILVAKDRPYLMQQLPCTVSLSEREEEEWAHFPLTQQEDREEGSMSPDSLELMDQEWEDMRRTAVDGHTITTGTLRQPYLIDTDRDMPMTRASNSLVCAGVIKEEYDSTFQNDANLKDYAGFLIKADQSVVMESSTTELDIEEELSLWRNDRDYGSKLLAQEKIGSSVEQTADATESERRIKCENTASVEDWSESENLLVDNCEDGMAEWKILEEEVAEVYQFSVDKLNRDDNEIDKVHENVDKTNAKMETALRPSDLDNDSNPRKQLTTATNDYSYSYNDAGPALSIDGYVTDEATPPQISKALDDWYDKEEFDNWCAELL